MKKSLFALTIVLLTIGCKSGNRNNPEKTIAAGDKPIPYFAFDEVTCYQAGYENTIIDTLNTNEHRSAFDSLKKAVLLDKTPASINDTAFILQLKKMGYREKIIDTVYLKEIGSIFSLKPNLGSVKASCPVVLYQHILIFRNGGHITGMAKINFRCTQQQITGTPANTDYFGQNGDYERLEELLEK